MANLHEMKFMAYSIFILLKAGRWDAASASNEEAEEEIYASGKKLG